jgi:DNA-binding transcriptional ArsR family regulator
VNKASRVSQTAREQAERVCSREWSATATRRVRRHFDDNIREPGFLPSVREPVRGTEDRVGVLRIHFTRVDLARTHAAAVPDPLWELMLSLHWLQQPYWRSEPAGRLVFGGWRSGVLKQLRAERVTAQVRDLLVPLSPASGYFPDFLNPPEGLLGLDTGIDAVLRTPRRRLAAELSALPTGGAAGWLSSLATGELAELRLLESALRTYHRLALAPHWPRLRERIAADHVRRGQAVRHGGVEALLASLGPRLRWRPPVLEVPGPATRGLRLGGRGLVLVPSYFCWTAVPLADPTLPPVLVYPVEHHPDPELIRSRTRGQPLGDLLGATRATVLRLAASGATVSELAAGAGISVGAASRHAQVLRQAGLVTGHRDAGSVNHVLTPLGSMLLNPGPLRPRGC